MFKEIVISIVIVISIFALNNITESYTKDSIEKMSVKFNSIKTELLSEEEPKKELLIQQIDELMANWEQYNEILSYYIEHDELEKVDTHLVALKGNIESEDYEQSIENIDVCIYILEHIDDKEAFLLKNIF